jgi:hypothetical protein
MGEAKLAGDTVEVGNGGMAGALERFTAGVRVEDGGLKGRSMPEREEKGTLIGTDQNIADAHRVMRKLVYTQEAWTGFVGQESTIMA